LPITSVSKERNISKKTLEEPVTSTIEQKFSSDSFEEYEKSLNSFFDAIIGSIDNIPYGFRLILKQMSEFMHIKFTKITDEEMGIIFGFYLYFKFLNPSIVDPSQTGIFTQDQVNLDAIKNLQVISKVLQALFGLRTLPKDNETNNKYNKWIKSKTRDVLEFFKNVIDVSPPEDELQVDRYTELYSKQDPIIIIRLREIVEMHGLVKEHIDTIVGDDKDQEDPLRTIIKELGEIPEVSENSTTDTELILKNRFGSRFEQELSDYAELFDITKELIIKVFRITPVDQSPSPILPDILEFAQTYAKENENSKLATNAAEARENVLKLEKVGFISSDDNYGQFIKSIAAEISNRAVRREQQQKEIIKLKTALREIKNHHKFVTDRIGDMERYLESCREKLKNKKKQNKPLKFSYKQLTKEGVIAYSDVLETQRGTMNFYISMPEVGVFKIEAKVAKVAIRTMKLELEELLAKKDAGENTKDLDNVTLNVIPTVNFMNKHFLR